MWILGYANWLGLDGEEGNFGVLVGWFWIIWVGTGNAVLWIFNWDRRNLVKDNFWRFLMKI